MTNYACFVCGTNTDVGKTIVCGGLLQNLPNAHILKVVQTGNELVDQNTYLEVVQQDRVKTLLHFPLASSPHLAAREVNYTLNLENIKNSVREEVNKHAFTLIEGSGGIMTPLSENETFLDLMSQLNYPVLLVVKNTLGAINQALLSLFALQSRGIQVFGIVMNQSEKFTSDEELLIAKENICLIANKSGLPVTTVPFFPQTIESKEKWAQIAKSLEKVSGSLFNKTDENDKKLSEFDQKHLWHPYEEAITSIEKPIVNHAIGARLILNNGKSIIDGTSSWWSAIHGYSHPELIKAVQTQSAKLSHVMFGGLTHEPAIILGQKLLTLAPKGLAHIFYSDSGSVAIEIALKMVAQYWHGKGKPNKSKFISFDGGYHGDTLNAMNVSGSDHTIQSPSNVSMAQNIFVPKLSISFNQTFEDSYLNPLRQIIQQHHHECGAVIIEPILQGAGGMWFYHLDYLKEIRKLCDEYDLLLIVDEIATGFGRTGKLFACEWANIAPDIMCIGKALTGGMLTLAATLASDKVASGISAQGDPLMHGPTYMANPLACHVANTSIDLLLKTSWQENVLQIEQWLREGLQNCLCYPEVQGVRALGAVGVVELKYTVNTARLQKYFIDQGVWIRPFKNIIYIMPAYTISFDELSYLIQAIEKAIKDKAWV